MATQEQGYEFVGPTETHDHVIELNGGWALATPYVVTSQDVELEVEHLSDGMTVTAPVGWRVHIPSHSGIRYVYIPEGWSSVVPLATQCVVLENGASYVNLTYREPAYSPCNLEVSSASGRARLTWRFGVPQPPSFRALVFDSWQELIDDHRAWMQTVAGVKPIEECAPAWLARCPLVIYLDIERIDGAGLHHEFADATRLATALRDSGAPDDTLIYLTSWNEGGERRYPTYEPSEAAGGRDGLVEAARAIHEHGYRLMLHTNLWGCAPNHPEYTRLAPYIVHNRAGHPLRWTEFHGRHVSEFVYVRPDSRPFRELFWGGLRELVGDLQLDLLYLDQAGLLVDDPLGDILTSTRSLIEEIKGDYPGLALGGQVVSSRLCDTINLWQLWGTPWSGHGWGQPFRRRSPLVADLFRGFTRFIAHLHLPAAVPGRFLWTHEAFADDLGTVGCFLAAQEDNSYHGAMPCLRLNFREHGIDPLSLEVILQAARRATG